MISPARFRTVYSRWMAGRSGRVYLTFDDGPDPDWTPRILESLAVTGARATFFVIGEHVARHPEVVRAVRSEGHEVELHCMRHVRHVDSSREEAEADTAEALELLRSLGVRPQRWRPPGGVAAPWTAAVAKRHGLALTGWSADPADWLGDDVAGMLDRVSPAATAGRVVVMHDGIGPGAVRGDCASTVALIPRLVELVRARGLEPSALGQGRAFWWLRSGVAAGLDGGVELEVVEEDDLSGPDAARVCALLAKYYTRDRDLYQERGWRRVRPAFRTIARVDGEIVGQQSVFAIGTEPPSRLFGLGDVVVHLEHRKRGIARALIRLAVERAHQRGAELILTDTVAVASTFYVGGFKPVPRFALYYERDGECRWHPNWLAWGRDEGRRLRLDEGDF